MRRGSRRRFGDLRCDSYSTCLTVHNRSPLVTGHGGTETRRSFFLKSHPSHSLLKPRTVEIHYQPCLQTRDPEIREHLCCVNVIESLDALDFHYYAIAHNQIGSML